jgi:hypothetical protein
MVPRVRFRLFSGGGGGAGGYPAGQQGDLGGRKVFPLVFGRHVFLGISAGHAFQQQTPAWISRADSGTRFPALEQCGGSVQPEFTLLLQGSMAGIAMTLQQRLDDPQVVGLSAA